MRKFLRMEPLEERRMLTMVAVPSSTVGELSTFGEVDSYTFNAEAGTGYLIAAEFGATAVASLNVGFELVLRSEGVDLQSRNTLFSGVQSQSSIFWTPSTEGIYEVLVVGREAQGVYTLNIEEAVDDGDTLSDATAVSVPSLTVGSLATQRDVDVFAFSSEAGELYRIALEGANSIEFYTSSGERLFGNSCNSRRCQLPEFHYVTPDASDYFVVVRDGGDYALEIETVTYGDDHSNLPMSASEITPMIPMFGQFEVPGDMDVFSFEATRSTQYNISTIFVEDVGNEVDAAQLRIFDVDGTTVLVHDARGRTFLDGVRYSSFSNWTAPADGIYFAAISPEFRISVSEDFTASQSGDYMVRIEVAPDDDHGGTPELATPIVVPSQNAGRSDFARDVDVFSVAASAGQQLNALLQADEFVDVSVYGADGSTLIATDRDRRDSVLSWTATVDGIYYVSVTQWISLGDYTLSIESPVDDHGSTFDTASLITLPVLIEGAIDFVGDVDVFRFDAIPGTLYEFGSDNTSLRLFDSSNALQSVDAGRWIASDDGVYYLQVANLDASAIGTYSVELSVVNYDDDHGNLAATATRMSIDTDAVGVIEVAGDADYFAFDATAGTTYNFVVPDAPQGAPMEILDVDGRTILELDFRRFRLDTEILAWTATVDGTYFVKYKPAHAGTYEFRIETLIDDNPGGIESAVPLVAPSVREGVVDFVGDSDFYSFIASAGTGYRFSVRSNGATAFFAITDLRLYINGTLIATSEHDRFSSSLNWTATTDEQIQIEVFGSPSDYEFRALVDDVPDGIEFAVPLVVPSVREGAIDFVGDSDFYSFVASAGTSYQFTTRAPGTTGMRLHYSGIVVATTTGEGISTLTWTALTSGAFHVEVHGPPNEYTLESQVTLEECDLVGAGNGCDIDDLTLFQALAATSVNDNSILAWLDAASSASNAAKARPEDVYRFGDIDLDGDVDSEDLGRLLNGFGQEGLWSEGNLNTDLVVDSEDLGLLLNEFGFTSPPSALATSAEIHAASDFAMGDFVFGDFGEDEEEPAWRTGRMRSWLR